jgi:hypothetical protein
MRTFWGIFIILIGLSALFGIPFFHVLFAIFLIYLGTRILSGKRHHPDFDHVTTVSEDVINEVIVLGPINKVIKSGAFESVRLVLVFAGGVLDLSHIKTQKKTLDFEIVAAFGGVKIILPKGWQAKSENVAILGGIDNKTNGTAVTVNFKGVTIFGGVEIVNG